MRLAFELSKVLAVRGIEAPVHIANDADAIAAFLIIAYQLVSSWPQPLSPLTSFWFSQLSQPGGQTRRMWK